MAYEKKDGDMVIFANSNRKTEKHPSLTGELLLGGTTYDIALWPKPDRNGKTFWAGMAKVKGQRPVGRMADDKVPDADLRKPEDLDDKDLPF